MSFRKCIQEAIVTYDYLVAESDLELSEMDALSLLIREFFQNEEYNEDLVEADDLISLTPLHSQSYDGELPEKFSEGCIVVIKGSDGRSLIIDGNHRRNTAISRSLKNKFTLITVHSNELLKFKGLT